jgi:hypothetical protein
VFASTNNYLNFYPHTHPLFDKVTKSFFGFFGFYFRKKKKKTFRLFNIDLNLGEGNADDIGLRDQAHLEVRMDCDATHDKNMPYNSVLI